MLKLTAKIGIPVFLITACLWAIYRFLGSDVATIVSFVLSIILILIFIVWIARKIFSNISTARARREKAPAAAFPSTAGSEEQFKLEALQRSLNAALKIIMESKLARGRKSSEALYSLPWVLMLGPTESGKTTALQECGVEFPYIASEARKPKKGAATIGCNYWFSRNAVVLDLEGSIATEEEEFEVFSGFLDQLKRARKDRPLDGVVLAVSIKEILDQPTDQVEALAGSLRKRFDAMIRRLGIRFPVYLLFTKCDQIEGFPEFFGGFRSRNRAQVWGATISRDQTKHQSADQIFQSEFDRLAATLSAYRLRGMASEKNPDKLFKIYGFPSRFASMRKKLEDFVGTLLQPTPYSEKPMFRGFYFASAAGTTAYGEPLQQPEADWDPNRRLATPQEQPSSTRSYFLETLLPRVIFADRPLAKASVYTRLRRRLWLDIAFFATLALCAVLLAGIIYSFTENRALIESTRSTALQLTDSGWNAKRTSDLVAMQTLRQRLEEHATCQADSVSWSPRCALYSGEAVASSARRVYFRQLRDAFISPTADTLRKTLTAFSMGTQSSAGYSEFYSCLKAYLMMTEHPERSDAAFLKNTLSPIWTGFAPEGRGKVAAEEQLDFYVQQLPITSDLPLTPDSRLVAVARRHLAQYPAIERIFAHLKEEGNKKLPPFALKQATGGKSLEYMISSYEVPGVFTKAGWSGYFRDAVGPASKEAVMDDWVLGPASNIPAAGQLADADFESLLRKKYFDEYIEQWQKFLDGISVRRLADLSDARAALDSFSQQDSALSRLLLNVADNTMLPKEPEKGKGFSETLSSIGARIGFGSRIDRTQLVESIANEFRPLHDVVTSTDDKTPSISAQYIDALMNVQGRLRSLFGEGVEWDKVKLYADKIANSDSSNEFQKGYDIAELIRKQCTTPSTRMIAPLLEQPLRETWAAILKEISHLLDGRWRTQIRDVYSRDLENSFPFNPAGEDVSLSTLTQFLKPNDGTLEVFYQNELKMFLSLPGSAYVPKKLNNEQVNFSPGFLEFMGKMSAMRQALFFPAGSPEISISFDLTPNSTPGISESIIDIDGQRLVYRNEPLSPKRMTWPSKQVASLAKLSVSLGGSGERPASTPFEGEWALFRLLSLAEMAPKNQTTYDATWSLPTSSGGQVLVRYRLRASSFQNPFAKGFFSSIVCPERVSRPQAD